MAAPYPPIAPRAMTFEQRSQAISHKIAHTYLKFSEWQNGLAGRYRELDSLMVAAKKRIRYLEYMMPRAPQYLIVERQHLLNLRREGGSVPLNDAVQRVQVKIRELEDLIRNGAQEMVQKKGELEGYRTECKGVKETSVDWMRCLEGLGWENHEISEEIRRPGLEGSGGDGNAQQDGPPQFPRPHGQLISQQDYQRFTELYDPASPQYDQQKDPPPPQNGPPEDSREHRQYGPPVPHIGQQYSLPPIQYGPLPPIQYGSPPAGPEYGPPSLRGGLYSPPPLHNGLALDVPWYDPSPLQNGQQHGPPPPQYGGQYAAAPPHNGQQYGPHQSPPMLQPLGGFQPEHVASPHPRLPASPAPATMRNVQNQFNGCNFHGPVSLHQNQHNFQGPLYQNFYGGANGPPQNGPRDGPQYPPQYGA